MIIMKNKNKILLLFLFLLFMFTGSDFLNSQPLQYVPVNPVVTPTFISTPLPELSTPLPVGTPVPSAQATPAFKEFTLIGTLVQFQSQDGGVFYLIQGEDKNLYCPLNLSPEESKKVQEGQYQFKLKTSPQLKNPYPLGIPVIVDGAQLINANPIYNQNNLFNTDNQDEEDENGNFFDADDKDGEDDFGW